MKVIRYILVGALVIFTMIVVFCSGLMVAWFNPEQGQFLISYIMPSASPSTTQSLPEDKSNDTTLKDLFVPFWQAWDIVHAEYVDQPVDDTKLMQGAISGMMDSLGDPHTSYMNPLEYEQISTPLEGSYEGIGAWVDTTGDYLTIISAMPGSPAEEVGLQPDDIVLAVNGKDMTGVDGDLVLKEVKGPADTEVTLTIGRESVEAPFDVVITRREIEVPSLESRMLEDNIAYIGLYTYGLQTPDELKTALTTLLANNPDGLILDLRNNGGGYLDSAIEILSEFITKDQVLMYEEMGDGTRKTYSSIEGGLATEIPLVVLINGGSASASEITAGAIQDYERGTIVGEQSYGKGSVQIWTALYDEQGAIRVTVARWLTPKERQINSIGIKPDVEVTYTEEDFNAGIDPQLDKAIQILKDGRE
jgi:carboxyl-terminal processing protease